MEVMIRAAQEISDIERKKEEDAEAAIVNRTTDQLKNGNSSTFRYFRDNFYSTYRMGLPDPVRRAQRLFLAASASNNVYEARGFINDIYKYVVKDLPSREFKRLAIDALITLSKNHPNSLGISEIILTMVGPNSPDPHQEEGELALKFFEEIGDCTSIRKLMYRDPDMLEPALAALVRRSDFKAIKALEEFGWGETSEKCNLNDDQLKFHMIRINGLLAIRENISGKEIDPEVEAKLNEVIRSSVSRLTKIVKLSDQFSLAVDKSGVRELLATQQEAVLDPKELEQKVRGATKLACE